MDNKKIYSLFAVSLLAFVFVIILTQIWDVPLRNAINRIVAYILYGLLVASFIFRFALIFLGVFSVYRIFRERHQKQIAV